MEDVYELFVRGTELLEAGHNHQATIPLERARDLAPDKKMIINLPFTVHLPVTEGQAYEFSIKEKDLKFFDKESGLRIPQRKL